MYFLGFPLHRAKSLTFGAYCNLTGLFCAIPGAFVYYRDDGTAIAYVVENCTLELDTDFTCGMFESLADTFYAVLLVECFHFSKKYVRYNSFKDCKERVEHILKDGSNRFPYLHQALQVKTTLANVCKIVKKYGFHASKDEYGWNPLHYACRFNAANVELVKWLLDQGAKNDKDDHGRFPLHLACDSSPSEAVVELLLEQPGGKGLVLMPTLYLKVSQFAFLP